jgi:RNA polymerase sigma factor (sigma-70 family)
VSAQARGGEDVEALFRRYGPELRRHAARLLHGTSHDPDDVLQEVTLRALARHGDAPLDLAYPRAWLHTCVQNACLSHLRSARAAPPVVGLDDTALADGEHGDPYMSVARRTEAREVLEDLARLDARQQRALLVSALSEGSHADVAAELGGTERAVTSLVSRARGNLKAMRAARATPCSEIRAEIDLATGRGVRAPELVRRHTLSCRACRLYGEGRRRRARVAAWLAPFHGLIAALQPSAPIAGDATLVHGAALVAVLAGGLASTAPSSPPPPLTATAHVRLAPQHAVRTTPIATRATTSVRLAAPRKEAHRATEQTAATPHRSAPARRDAAPVKENLFGCPQVHGRMTAADAACRNAHRDDVRRAIEARLAKQRATATPAPAEATPSAAPPAPAPAEAPAPSPRADAPPPAHAESVEAVEPPASVEPPAPGAPTPSDEPPAPAPVGAPPPAAAAPTPAPAPVEAPPPTTAP